jgi:hypothetical protein
LAVDHAIGGIAYQFVAQGLAFDYVIVLRTQRFVGPRRAA